MDIFLFGRYLFFEMGWAGKAGKAGKSYVFYQFLLQNVWKTITIYMIFGWNSFFYFVATLFILKNKSRKNAIKIDKHETNFQIFPGPPNQGCLYYFIFILPDFVPT